VSLAARHLEAAGIPTVILGSARDIVEHCGVPRFVFTDFPLGNPCGKPYDAEMQRAIVGYGIELLASARFPRTTVQTPFVWSEAGEARRAARATARAEGRLQGWTGDELGSP
jgi:D-proline reductase (dithiol) PrdB